MQEPSVHQVAPFFVKKDLRQPLAGEIVNFISGGAPLSAEIAAFFATLGYPIYEGYGLTETSPVITVNTESHVRMGSVGRPIPGIEVRIAPDGEILTRGPHVMKGYHNKPEATADTIDPEGWLHTGDIGQFDADGYLHITDRKKDIIVTAGGKNIAPQPIDAMAKRSRFVASAVMLGDRRKFPIMLIVPQFDPLTAWAKEQGLAFTDHASLIALPQIESMMEKEVLSQFTGINSGTPLMMR